MGKNKKKNKGDGVDIVNCHRCSQSGTRHFCIFASPSSSASSSIEQRMKEMSDSFALQLQQQQEAHKNELAELRNQLQQKESQQQPSAVSSAEQVLRQPAPPPSPVSTLFPPPTFGFRPPQMFSSPSPGFGVASGQPAAQSNLPPLPMFSGEQGGENQFTLWELNFSNDMVAAGNPAPFWTRYLWRYLSGAALAAYHEFLATDPDIQYGELVRKFRKRFDRAKTASDYQKEVDRLFWGRNESIEDFGERCSSLFKKLHRCQPDKPADHQSVFLRCMPPHICQILRGHIRVLVDPDAPVELAQLVRWVRRYLDDCDKDKALDKERKMNMELTQERSRGPPRMPFAGQSSRPPLQPQTGAWPVAPQVGQQQQQQRFTQPQSFPPPQQNPSGGAREGPLQPSSKPLTGQQPRACFECGDPGHLRYQCPLRVNLPVTQSSNQVQVVSSSASVGARETRRSQTKKPISPLPEYGFAQFFDDEQPLEATNTVTALLPPAVERLSADLEGKVDATPELKEHLAKRLPSFSAQTMMFIPIKIADMEVDAQIDTGSPVVIINKEIVALLAERHGREAFSKMVQPVTKSFTDMQHNVIPLEGMVDVEFELNGVKIICPAMISLKLHCPVLIGLSFFERVGLELSIPTGDSVVRWVLSPDQTVNGEPIQVFFGRYRKRTLQDKGERRRQQKRERRNERSKVGLIEKARCLYPQLGHATGAVSVQPRLIEAATAAFVQFLAYDTRHFGRTAIVEEFGLSAEHLCSVPDQLVSVSSRGFFWVEVRNDGRLDVSLEAGDLVVQLEEPLSVERMSILEQTVPISQCARCRRCKPAADGTVAVALEAPANLNLQNLQYSSLEDRLQSIADRADVGGDNANTSAAQRAQMLELLQKNHDVVALDDMELGESTYGHLAHQIDTGDHPPIAQPCRRLPFSIRAGVEKTLNTMQNSGVIRPSSSPWASPIVPVRKPDGSIRITVDYRRLNAITVLDKYPIACCEDLLDSIGTERPQFFSTLDLAAGYHQQLMHPNSIAKTAFQCPFGHFEYTRLPMGLTNAPANFQRLLDELLRGVDREKIKNYLDDVAIVTHTFEEHLRQLQIVFDRFRQAGLRVKLSKCKLLRKEVLFLGFLIDHTGLRPNPVRVQGILEIKPPKSLKEIRQFIGCCSYYRRFVKGFAEIARPLTNLLRKDSPWEWGDKQQQAFETLKAALISPPVLHYPRFGEPFYIICDASSAGLGAILHQKDESGKYAPVAFASRATHRTEQNYSATDLEALCLTWSLQNFHHYIVGHELVVELDHAPLMALNSKAKLPPRLERWNTIISNYGAKIVYRKGKENEAADMLSRYQQVAGSADEPAIDESSIIGLIETAPPVVDPSVFPADIVNQRLLQLQDSFFGRLIRYLEDPKSVQSTERQMLKKMSACYRLCDGVLYFRRECDTFDRICIPAAEQAAVVESYHCGKNSGAHLSALKTYHKMALRFFWPSMKSDVFRFCRRCLICALEHGVERRRRPPLQPVSVQSEPFTKIGIDVIKFPLTSSGNDRALGIVDYFSGFLIFVAIPNETAATIADILVERVFNVFGAPQEIVSDQGVNFTSVLLKELEVIFKIKHRFTTTFTPRSNGKIERANRTMKAILTRLTTGVAEDWDRLLSHATFAYNSTPQESTGLAPHYVVFGRLPQPVSESVFDRRALGHKLDLDDYVSQLERNLSSAYATVQQELGKSQLRQQDDYNKSAAVSKMIVGDCVMLFRPDLKSTKLKPSFDGPYKVVWLKQNTAGIQRVSGGQVEVHNLDKLSRCPSDMLGNPQSSQNRHLRTHFRNRRDAIKPKRGRVPYNLRSTKDFVISVVMDDWDEVQFEEDDDEQKRHAATVTAAENAAAAKCAEIELDYGEEDDDAESELSPVFTSSAYGGSFEAPPAKIGETYDPLFVHPAIDPRFPNGPPPICDPLPPSPVKKVLRVRQQDIGEPWSLGPPKLPLTRRQQLVPSEKGQRSLSASSRQKAAVPLAAQKAPRTIYCPLDELLPPSPPKVLQREVSYKDQIQVNVDMKSSLPINETRPKLKSVVFKMPNVDRQLAETVSPWTPRVWDVAPTPFVPVVNSDASVGESWRGTSSSVVSQNECWRPKLPVAGCATAVQGERLVVKSVWRPRGKRAGKKAKSRHRSANW